MGAGWDADADTGKDWGSSEINTGFLEEIMGGKSGYSVNHNGDISDKLGRKVGRVSHGGKVTDKRGSPVGNINYKGDVTSAEGRHLGHFYSDGDMRGADGRPIHSLDSGSRLRMNKRNLEPRLRFWSTGDCFVATTVYGDPHAPQVEALREIKDEILIPNTIGKILVEWYYSGKGKRMADYIAEHPFAIPPIKLGLDAIVLVHAAYKKYKARHLQYTPVSN